jgi:hypothetical protein
VIGLGASYRTSIHSPDLHIWTITRHMKKEVCKGDKVISGTLAIPLKAFGSPAALAVKYPSADLGQRVNLSFDELAACYYAAIKAHNVSKLPRGNSSLVEALDIDELLK